MQNDPNFEHIAAALADISRKRMLCALMDGRAHTGKELALCAGVTASTASGHMAMLRAAGLILSEKSGRSTYHRLAGAEVAALLEGMAALVPPSFAARLRAVRKSDPDSLLARCCYDHIAGALGVAMCRGMLRRGAIVLEAGAVRAGYAVDVLEEIAGIVVQPGAVLGRSCLDWSERQPHLAGTLGRAILLKWQVEGWIVRNPQGRGLTLTPAGRVFVGDCGLSDGLTDAKAMTVRLGPALG